MSATAPGLAPVSADSYVGPVAMRERIKHALCQVIDPEVALNIVTMLDAAQAWRARHHPLGDRDADSAPD